MGSQGRKTKKGPKRNQTNRTTSSASSSYDGGRDDYENEDGVRSMDSSDVEEDLNDTSTKSSPRPSIGQRIGFSCFQFRERGRIRTLEQQLVLRQKRFGVKYLDLIEQNAGQQALKKCLNSSMREIAKIQNEINRRTDILEEQQQKY